MMIMTEFKEPGGTDRKSVILSDAERRNLRRKLRETVEIAQDVLHPRNQMKLLVDKGKVEATRIAGSATRLARKNAPIIGAVGLGAILFAARRPISKWISTWRQGRSKPPVGE